MSREPELRFPGFTGPWREVKLGEIIKEFRKHSKINNEYPVMTSSNKGLMYQSDYFDNERIQSKNNVGFNIIPEGYITYRSRSDKREFTFNINNLKETGIISNFYPVFTTSGSNKFFIELLNYHKHKIGKYSVGTSQTVLSINELKKIKLYFPDIKEQQKIADFLTAVDEKIEIQTQKIDRLETYKRGVMQKLLSGEIRFSGFTEPWREVRLGDVFAERSERCGDCNLPLLAVTNSQGVILRDQLDRHDTSSSDKSNYKIVRKNDIAYNSMRMWQGTSGVSRYEGIISPAYTVIYLKKDYDINFFGYLFKLQRVIFDFYRYSQGLTSDTWNLKYRQLSEIKVTITPLKKEQQKIADFLTAIDNKIELEKERLEHLQTYKKGLLQKMFI